MRMFSLIYVYFKSHSDAATSSELAFTNITMTTPAYKCRHRPFVRIFVIFKLLEQNRKSKFDFFIFILRDIYLIF